MSNVDSSSTNEHHRSLRNIFLDLKSDLGLISESGQRVKKRFEEYIGSSSELSANSNSNFDDELSLMLKNTNKSGNLFDILNRKYLIGYAISEAFSGTDLDAYTLFHLWSAKRTSQKSLLLCDQPSSHSEENVDLEKTSESTQTNSFVVFFQQLFYGRQSKLKPIDRTRPIFKIPPQDHSIVHAIEPKTTSLILLSCIYGIKNIKFVGLKNHATHARVPGPFLSLLSMDSKTDFITCMNWIQDSVFNKDHVASSGMPKADSFGAAYQSATYSNFEGFLNISYFLHELDFIYSYVLVHGECYAKYTEPILLKSFTGWTFGKISLLFYKYRMRYLYKNVSLSEILSRLNVVLSLICKIFSEYKSSHRQNPVDKCNFRSFNFYCFTSLVYSYLYSILSIPLELLPWENYVFDKRESCKATTAGAEIKNYYYNNHNTNSNGINSGVTDSISGNANATELNEANDELNSGSNGLISRSSSNDSSSVNVTNINSGISVSDLSDTHYDESDDNNHLGENYNIINMAVHNEFAETAADSTCVENTRRHDNLMTYVIGIVNGEGNWIKRKEKFVDVIDTYKLGLSWYRRPSFSNTLYNTSYKAWPIALFYYNLLIEPCGRVFFVWYWKNIEAWGSSNIWAYSVKKTSRKKSSLYQFLSKLSRRSLFSTDSNLQLKRQVSLRLRDTVSFIFDMELELKRSLLYS